MWVQKNKIWLPDSTVYFDRNPLEVPDIQESAFPKLSLSEVDEGTERNILHAKQNEQMAFTLDIVDKQYRSYIWNDGKVQAMATIDAALLAAIFIVIQVFKNITGWAVFFLSSSFILLAVSLIISLRHAIPKLDSGVGNQDNLRSIIGIVELEKQDYHKAILNLSKDEMISMNCHQISGMARNCLESQKIIKKSVMLKSFSILLLIVAVTSIFLTAPNYTESFKSKAIIPPHSESKPSHSIHKKSLNSKHN